MTGALWTATDANGQWAAVDPGVGPDVDLIASGPRRYNYRGLVILGSQRTAAFHDEEDGWTVRTLDIVGEPIAYAEGLAITDSGEILEIDEFARAEIVKRPATIPDHSSKASSSSRVIA
ncbi:MAG: hypothetical protein KC457_29320 [Myxococcales bacterium]|nr:hypothetical protein [Myxococcales bacterium]